jgi:hypothetical protein
MLTLIFLEQEQKKINDQKDFDHCLTSKEAFKSTNTKINLFLVS